MNIGIANIDNITVRALLLNLRNIIKTHALMMTLKGKYLYFHHVMMLLQNNDMSHVNDIAGYVGLSNIKPI